MAGGLNPRGSISVKPDLTIDIPVDKRADRNPSFKTPNNLTADTDGSLGGLAPASVGSL